jgi:hypothetical protein
MDDYGRLIPAVNRFPSSADGRGFKPLADFGLTWRETASDPEAIRQPCSRPILLTVTDRWTCPGDLACRILPITLPALAPERSAPSHRLTRPSSTPSPNSRRRLRRPQHRAPPSARYPAARRNSVSRCRPLGYRRRSRSRLHRRGNARRPHARGSLGSAGGHPSRLEPRRTVPEPRFHRRQQAGSALEKPAICLGRNPPL